MSLNRSPGLRVVENREVKGWMDGNRALLRKEQEENPVALNRKIRQQTSDDKVGAWRRMDGGQGVLSRLEGEGLRAHRARGRATPTEAIESSVAEPLSTVRSLKRRNGLSGSRRKSVKA